MGGMQGGLLSCKLPCYQRTLAPGGAEIKHKSIFVADDQCERTSNKNAKFKHESILLQTTNVNIQQAFRAGYEFDNLMVAHEFENVSVSLALNIDN